GARCGTDGGGAAGAMYYADHRSDGTGSASGRATAGQGTGKASETPGGKKNGTGATGATGATGGTGGNSGSGGNGGKTGGGGSIPANWVRVHAPEGFSLMLPPGWKRKVDGSQIDFTPDGGKRFVRIGIERSPDWQSSYLHQLDLERQVRKRLPDYRRLQLHSNTYRDRKGSRWEFTWTAGSGDAASGPQHAIEQSYMADDGTEYAIYFSVPAAQWPVASQQFPEILRSWRTS
ncbi:serine/threonine protein kinase, partial [Streptomyces sp. GXMU-J5]|nr:serine/threonine protein kinase [Streptomyces beihaiensis]